MSLPIELCCLPLPCRRPSTKLGPNHEDWVVLHLLQTRLPQIRCPLYQQGMRRHLGRLATLQPENTVAPARKPKIMCNDERGKTIVAM
jgi:hypothetical protein